MSEEVQDAADVSRELKQKTTKTLDEIKQQWNDVKRLIKENRPSQPSLGLKEVLAVVVIAAAFWLSYAAYDDITTRQRDILHEIKSLQTEMGKNAVKLEKAMDLLKTEVHNAVKASTEHAAKLLTRIENSSKH